MALSSPRRANRDAVNGLIQKLDCYKYQLFAFIYLKPVREMCNCPLQKYVINLLTELTIWAPLFHRTSIN